MTTENSTKPENVAIVNPVTPTPLTKEADPDSPSIVRDMLEGTNPNESDQEHYERVWGGALLEDKVKEGLTTSHMEQIARAPGDEEVDMSNLHMPTKDEVAHRIVKSILDSNNTKITITTVEELKDFEAKNSQAESSDNYTNDIIRSFATTKTNVHIEPKVFFDYIKGSLSETESEDLANRLKRFTQIFELTAKSGQLALKENARDNIIRLVKEQEAAACGYKTYIFEKTINTFLKSVKDKAAFFKPFREFPRLIPDEILGKLTASQSKNIFDEYWILYLDYSKENIKSTATKVKDKDPILFGKVTKDSNKLFYIADWVDEYCDLTLDKFVDAMKKMDSSYTLPEVALPKINEIGELLEEKKRQEEVLAKTNNSNYRSLAAQESGGATENLTKSRSQSLLRRIFTFSF